MVDTSGYIEYGYNDGSANVDVTVDVPVGGKVVKIGSDVITSELGHEEQRSGQYSVCIDE